MAGGLSITVITGVADHVEPLLSWTVTVMVKVAEGVPFANEYAWLSVVGGPDIVSVVPSPQFTVVVAMVPSGSEAEMVMMTVCPGVTVVEDRVGVTVGGLSVMVDRKSTRLNSSHRTISYAVFCLKKKKYYMPLRSSADRSNPSQRMLFFACLFPSSNAPCSCPHVSLSHPPLALAIRFSVRPSGHN